MNTLRDDPITVMSPFPPLSLYADSSLEVGPIGISNGPPTPHERGSGFLTCTCPLRLAWEMPDYPSVVVADGLTLRTWPLAVYSSYQDSF